MKTLEMKSNDFGILEIGRRSVCLEYTACIWKRGGAGKGIFMSRSGRTVQIRVKCLGFVLIIIGCNWMFNQR